MTDAAGIEDPKFSPPQKMTLKSAIALGLVFGVIGVAARLKQLPDFSQTAQTAELVGEVLGPSFFFSIIWFLFVGLRRADIAHKGKEISMAARLGQVMYWFCGAVSIIVGTFSIFALLTNGLTNLFPLAITVSCIAIYYLGRATRYILAGY